MIRRTGFFAVAVVAAACSQRSPWHPIHPTAPAAVPSGMSSSRVQPAVALRAAAAAPLALSVATDVPAAADATAVAHLRGLFFPVGGVDSMRLDDSFEAPRDGGTRKHNAIDIMAPRGTPVLAVSDGRVLRLMKSSKGGLTLYASDLEDGFVYYYAHLDRYNPKLYSGKPLLRGDTLGYVGTTGNAPKNLPHLHFQVMRMPADGKFLNGEPINPYPLLRQTATTEK